MDYSVLERIRGGLIVSCQALEEEPLHSRNKIILPHMIDSLKELYIDSLCEGIETAEQCRYLNEIGCRYAQGFYFSKPVPVEDFYRMYAEQKGYFSLPYPVETDSLS